jgi:ABC-type transport system substrate-binding protein
MLKARTGMGLRGLLYGDYYGHSGASHLMYLFLDSSKYVLIYEEMWKDMAGTVDDAAQEEKMRQMEKYVYDHAYVVFTYSPLNLYAVNKEVNFVPQKSLHLRLKETSVTDNHWSVRSKTKVERPPKAQTQ